MNKIILNDEEKDFVLEDKTYSLAGKKDIYLNLSDEKKDINLVIEKDADISICLFGNRIEEKVKIVLKENSKLDLRQLIIDGRTEIEIVLEEKYATINYISSILSSSDSNNSMNIRHLSQGTNSIIKNQGFSVDKANIIFDINSYLTKDSGSSTTNQDSKIIQIEDSYSKINPNLIVDNFDVEATHSAYVGEFGEESLFYLMSRGIPVEEAKFLLLKSFLVGTLDLKEDVRSQYLYELCKYFDKEA